jgi:hypothetical protein
MPTILSIKGLHVVKYSNDHRPKHIHVIGSRAEATFVMKRPNVAPTLRDNFGFTFEQIDKIAETLAEHLGPVHIT